MLSNESVPAQAVVAQKDTVDKIILRLAISYISLAE